MSKVTQELKVKKEVKKEDKREVSFQELIQVSDREKLSLSKLCDAASDLDISIRLF